MDKINGKRIEKNLRGALKVFTFDALDSTNAEAKRRVSAGLSGPSLFVAEKQSAGRGRLGRSFYSPGGTGIYMTLAWPVPEGDSDFLRATAKAAVAVLSGLQRTVNAAIFIKWVNDIYYNGRKIAGILTESIRAEAEEGNAPTTWLIIGIGINAGTCEFPEELSDIAGSIEIYKNDRTGLIIDIMEELLPELINLSDKSYLDIYRSRSNILGRRIFFGTAPDFEEGRAVEIDDTGALIVEKDTGERMRLFTGEISVRPAGE